MEVLALVPARGGSKSMPRKNLRDVAGLPLIVHSIQHGLDAELVSRVVLTTDDEEIAQVGLNAGAEVPFLRPSEYAQDLSTDYEFVRHSLEWLSENEDYHPDIVVQLRPTTPLRDVRLINKAIQIFSECPHADSLRSVVNCCFSPYKMWSIDSTGFMSPVLTLEGVIEPFNQPRQILPNVFQQDGFIDIVRPSTIFEQSSITGKTILPFLIPEVSIDIDYEEDLTNAVRVMKGI